MLKKIFESGSDFIWKNARSLERAIFELNFHHGSPGRILQILRTYQNDDGGFGNALEPDLRTPESQPLFVEFALRTLYDSQLRDPEIAHEACDFLSSHADLRQGIPLVFPSYRHYPYAAHMDGPYVEQLSMERLTSLVGLLRWQGSDHPWLKQAVETCINFIDNTRFTDAHTIQNAFCLVEALSQERVVDHLYNRLAADLFESNFFLLETPVTSYGLTPLSLAPSPNSYCRRLFSEAQIEAHLADLESQQMPDGGWPILWEPPSETSRLEWRAYKTVMALSTLRAHRKI